MSPGDVFGALDAIGSLVAIGIALAAWRLAAQTFRRDHRPIVRVVPMFGAVNALRLDVVLLKNIGRGPAVTVIAYDPAAASLIGDEEVVEPLGPGEEERKRLGRVVLKLRTPVQMDRLYDLYYQDILGQWHATRFRPRPNKIECTFTGSLSERDVPGAVMVLGTVARP